MFKDKQEKNKKGKEPKQQQQHGERVQANLKRQQLIRQQQQQIQVGSGLHFTN